MKILLIMGGRGEGGLESHFIDICNALGKKHEVHVIAHPEQIPKMKSVVFHAFDMAKSRRNPFLLFSILKLIRQTKSDIIHAQANTAVAIVANG